jgi:hypothetical protein
LLTLQEKQTDGGLSIAQFANLKDQEFAAEFIEILDKGKQWRRLNYNTIQRALMPNLTGADIVLKYRQGGVSTAIQARHMRRALTEVVTLVTVAHDQDTTDYLRRMAAGMYNRISPLYDKPARKRDNARLATYTNGSEVVIKKAGSREGGRGLTFTEVHGSEVAFWPDAENIVTSLLEAGEPRILLESTPNGAQGYFYELCMGALDRKNRYRMHFFPWWIHEEYRIALESGEALDYTDVERELIKKHRLKAEQIKWRREKIRDLKHKFPQEYPEDVRECFLRSGTGYFGAIDHVFKIPPGSLTHDAAHRYVAGLDFGQQQDYTVLVVIDATTKQQVDMLRVNRMSWADIRLRIREMCQKWQVRLLVAENNNSSAVIEPMLNEFYAVKLKTSIKRFNMTAISKPPLMSDLYSTLHEYGLLLLDDGVMKHEFGAATARLTQRGYTVESPHDETGHGDTVIATALAAHGMGFV